MKDAEKVEAAHRRLGTRIRTQVHRPRNRANGPRSVGMESYNIQLREPSSAERDERMIKHCVFDADEKDELSRSAQNEKGTN